MSALDEFARKVICDCGHPAYSHDNYRCWDNHYECGCKKSQDELIKSQLARYEAIEAAAQHLLLKMNAVYNSDEYLAIWQSAQLHLGQYSGLNWIDEQSELAAALEQK